jgi:hypothetical protein
LRPKLAHRGLGRPLDPRSPETGAHLRSQAVTSNAGRRIGPPEPPTRPAGERLRKTDPLATESSRELGPRLQNLSTPTVDAGGRPWTGEDSAHRQKTRRSEPISDKIERHRHLANHYSIRFKSSRPDKLPTAKPSSRDFVIGLSSWLRRGYKSDQVGTRGADRRRSVTAALGSPSKREPRAALLTRGWAERSSPRRGPQVFFALPDVGARASSPSLHVPDAASSPCAGCASLSGDHASTDAHTALCARAADARSVSPRRRPCPSVERGPSRPPKPLCSCRALTYRNLKLRYIAL